MKTIWKYQLEVTGIQTIKMPVASQLLTIQIQNGIPCLWASVDSERILTDKTIETFGTGHQIDNSGPRDYLGTYQICDLVFHVFEYLGV